MTPRNFNMFENVPIVQRSVWWGIASVSSFFLVWQVCSMVGFINANLFPAPVTIARTIMEEFRTGRLINDIMSSLRRVLIGFGIGAVLGLFLGLLCALVSRIGYIVKPLIELIRPIPPIAWIPISILWFGFGEPAAYFLISFGSFFPVFSSTFLGISLVSKGTVDVARCHGSSNKMLFREIILPQALPSIFSGIRTALGVSWMIVITAELVGVQAGLGYFIQVSRSQLQTERVLAGMVVIGCIGLLLNLVLKVFSYKLMPWKKREQKIGTDE